MNSLTVNSTPESTMSKGHAVAEWRRRAPEGHTAGPCTQTCLVRAQEKEHAVAVVRNLGRPPRTLRAQQRLRWRQPLRYLGLRCDFADPRVGADFAGPLHSLMLLNDAIARHLGFMLGR
jgi:hypothetical protein